MAAAFVASPRAAPGGHPLPRSLDDRAGGDGATGGGDDGLAGRSLSLPRPQPPSQAALMPWMERANPTAILHILRSDEKEVGVFVFPNRYVLCLEREGRGACFLDFGLWSTDFCRCFFVCWCRLPGAWWQRSCWFYMRCVLSCPRRHRALPSSRGLADLSIFFFFFFVLDLSLWHWP